jgi:hypothetical protein
MNLHCNRLPVWTWECRLFGANEEEGIAWKVVKPPCWFWRWMQYVCFGNRWRKLP